MANNPIITILTPSYNRGYCLGQLANSLLNQTNLNYNWIIIDDGSTDNTKEIIELIKRDFGIKLQYLYKKNGGKHTAINYALDYINTELTFIVDSDDQLTNDAIATIYEYFGKYKNNKQISCYAFERKYPDSQINLRITDKEFIGNYIEDRIKKRKIGDMAEVYFTKFLKKFRFPEYENEKFIGEDVLWIKIAKESNMLFINKAIYIGSYLNDGLTKNRRKNAINSPKSQYLVSCEYMTIKKLPLKTKFKFLVFLIIYGRFAKYSFKKIIFDSKNKFLCTITIPFALIIRKIWVHKYIKN